MNKIETAVIGIHDIERYLNMGYEVICPLVRGYITEYTVREEVPVQRVYTSDNSGGYYSHQPQYVSKQYPATSITTDILVKRTEAARLLYEEKLKNENNS